MSFIGTINEKLRKFFYTHARLLEGRTCYIGCSGNFTIEQIISRLCPTTVLHSNDVSLYSAAIGHMLTSQPLALEATNPELTWANAYLSRGPAEQVATILLLLDLLQFEKRNNPYAERMWQGYLDNFESLFTRTLDKVLRAAAHIRLASYSMVDVFDYYPPPDPSAVAIGFLPTYVGGYEKLFARLEQSISWPCPSYQLLTEERREETIARMISTDYIVYDDRPRDLPCVARVDLFGKRTVYIYSSLSFRHAGIFRKKINEKVSRYDLLMPDDKIAPSAPITVAEVDLPTINHYRNMFLSKKIQPGSGGPCYLVFAAGRLFGFLIFQSYSARGGAKDEIYMLSDFVVPSSSHRRLAKLLLMVTRCQDTQRILSERLIRNYRAILTTAFTDQPVSMKYRGIYELVKRGQGFLNYRGEFDTTSFNEVTATWMKKYEKR